MPVSVLVGVGLLGHQGLPFVEDRKPSLVIRRRRVVGVEEQDRRGRRVAGGARAEARRPGPGLGTGDRPPEPSPVFVQATEITGIEE